MFVVLTVQPSSTLFLFVLLPWNKKPRETWREHIFFLWTAVLLCYQQQTQCHWLGSFPWWCGAFLILLVQLLNQVLYGDAGFCESGMSICVCWDSVLRLRYIFNIDCMIACKISSIYKILACILYNPVQMYRSSLRYLILYCICREKYYYGTCCHLYIMVFNGTRVPNPSSSFTPSPCPDACYGGTLLT